MHEFDKLLDAELKKVAPASHPFNNIERKAIKAAILATIENKKMNSKEEYLFILSELKLDFQ